MVVAVCVWVAQLCLGFGNWRWSGEVSIEMDGVSGREMGRFWLDWRWVALALLDFVVDGMALGIMESILDRVRDSTVWRDHGWERSIPFKHAICV